MSPVLLDKFNDSLDWMIKVPLLSIENDICLPIFWRSIRRFIAYVCAVDLDSAMPYPTLPRLSDVLADGCIISSNAMSASVP